MATKRKQYPSQARLRELFDYDPEGFLFWKYNPDRRPQWNGRYAGNIAGKYEFSPRTLQYVYRVGIGDDVYSGNSLIWIYFGGKIDERKQIHKKDWSKPPAIENLVQVLPRERKSRPHMRSSGEFGKGVTKRSGSDFFICEPVNGGCLRFMNREDAEIHYDNEYEKDRGERPNGTERRDVAEKILSMGLMRHIQHAKGALRKGKFLGVNNHRGKFSAYFSGTYLGVFMSQEDAARAYNIAAYERYGEHAVLNDIPDPLGKLQADEEDVF